MNKNTLSRVVDCIALTTRYPTELLTTDADLENDLGIDSVKNLEIVLALAEEFGLDLAREGRDANIRTIGKVAQWIDGLLGDSAAGKVHAPEFVRSEPPAVACDRQCKPPAIAKPSIKAPHFLPHSRIDEPQNSSKPLAGKVALVTGSGRGVGRTIARLLASRGAYVVVNSFHSRELGEQTKDDIQAQGGEAIHHWGSIANPNHVEHIFQQIEQQFGRLDILVCNASDGRIGSFMELTSDDWDRAFRTNVTGHYQCAMRAVDLMQPAGGSIITLSAVGSNRFIDGLGSQGVVKAAVETLTRYLACELGQFGIRTNCVVGGPVYGDLLSKFPSAQATQNHWESFTPDGQLCSPMDLANAIGFLVSEEASGINGSIWTVDHGFSAVADGRPTRPVSRAVVASHSI